MKAIKIVDKYDIQKFLKEKYFRVPTEEEINEFIKSYINLINDMRILEGNKRENENAIKLYGYYDTKDEIAIIMELCDDNLLNYYAKRKENFTADEIMQLLNQLNKTFRIMVENKINHGCINLKKIYLKYLDMHKTKYVAKLKLAPKIPEIKNKEVYCSPEILKYGLSEFNEASDLWSLGVIIYTLFFREYPYYGQNEEEILNKIQNKTLKKTGISNLDNLIMNLLIEDPTKRITWEKYFYHPFFKNNE